MIEQGEQLIPVEIKSSQTFHTDFLAGLQKWTRLAGAAALPPVLVYGGDDNMNRLGVTVQPWTQIHIGN